MSEAPPITPGGPAASPRGAGRIDRYAAWIILLFAAVVIPALYAGNWLSIETVNMLGRYMAFAIVALALDLVWGYTGALCLCQSLFFALGGYAMGMYLAHHGPLDGDDIPRCLNVVMSSVEGIELPWFWKPFKTLGVTLVLGLLIPGAAAFLIGWFGFASRVRGVFFAILTQATTLAVWLVFCRNDMKLCGTNGLTNFETLAGFDLEKPGVRLGLYLLTLASLVGVYLLSRRLVRSRVGRVLIAVRDNEDRLRFSGYKPHHFKVFVFTFAGMIAGLGGMLYAPQMGILTPSSMDVKASILVVIWVAVGGRGTLSGAILGALVVNLVYNFLTSRWPDSWPFVQGGAFVAVVLFLPSGLMSLWYRLLGGLMSLWHRLARPERAGEKVTSAEEGATPGEFSGELLERVRTLASMHSRTLLGGDLLRVENVTVLFDGFKALDVEHFSIGHRELSVIIGPNGAGKTTLCDVISGKTRPTSGKVFFGEKEITSMSEVDIARLGVGRKFQTPTVFDSLTVHENMRLALPGRFDFRRSLRFKDTSEETDSLAEVLARARLTAHANTEVRYLSHGQRQWLEIAMLILSGPMLLLVDEPAAGLTDEETVLTAELLLEARSEHSLIVIEHDMDFVRLLDSHVTVLNEGRTMAEGSMAEVQANEQVVEAYLGR